MTTLQRARTPLPRPRATPSGLFRAFWRWHFFASFLVVPVLAPLLSPAGKAQNAIANARRHATSYLDAEYTADPAERERIFRLLLTERDQIVTLGPKYRQKVRDEPALIALLERARDSHDAAVTRGEAAPTGAPKILDRAE